MYYYGSQRRCAAATYAGFIPSTSNAKPGHTEISEGTEVSLLTTVLRDPFRVGMASSAAGCAIMARSDAVLLRYTRDSSLSTSNAKPRHTEVSEGTEVSLLTTVLRESSCIGMTSSAAGCAIMARSAAVLLRHTRDLSHSTSNAKPGHTEVPKEPKYLFPLQY